MNNLESHTSTAEASGEKPKPTLGPVVSLIIILILIIAGSFYFLGGRQRPAGEPPEPAEAVNINDEPGGLEEQSESDEQEALEKNSEETNLNLDQGGTN